MSVATFVTRKAPSHLSVTSIVGVSKERIEYEKSISNCSNISSDQKQELNKN